MIEQISWASYWIAAAVAISVYYIILGLKFYFPEIKGFFSKKFVTRPDTFRESKMTSDDLFPLLNHLAQEIKMFFQTAAEKNLQQQEILYGIQLLLRKYPEIKTTSFEGIVSSHIINECSNYCSIHLDEDELNMLWGN